MLRQWDDIEFYYLALIWESVVFLQVVKQHHLMAEKIIDFLFNVIKSGLSRHQTFMCSIVLVDKRCALEGS